MRRALVVMLALLVAAPALARADDADYDPSSRAWNGLASFVAVAEGLGLEVDPVAALEWGDLDDGDILVLLYPLQRVDPGRLQAFIQAGGHVVVADDFGESREALTKLALIRAELATPRAQRFQDGRLYAPVATTIAEHPITTDVTEVITNHPAVLTQVEGADALVGFPSGESVVVAGERGTGRFVVVSDPSIFINRMLQFPGNLRLTAGILRWLARGGRADRLVLLRGDIPMYGEPKPFIDDAGAGPVGHTVADLNRWLDERNEYLLTTPAIRVLVVALAVVLGGIALLALPPWRRGRSDGRWLRLERPAPRDDLSRAVLAYDQGESNHLLPATVLRDLVQGVLGRATGHPDPLYTVAERDLLALVAAARGPEARAALHKVYRRLRGLPSRSQAAAPWAAGFLSAGDFEHLHADVTALCRTLGEEMN